jgi:hypothetical protein
MYLASLAKKQQQQKKKKQQQTDKIQTNADLTIYGELLTVQKC